MTDSIGIALIILFILLFPKFFLGTVIAIIAFFMGVTI
jgi:hypothetical protein|tara:strand:- start:258 stop:371 length:114 start_codon:yes stop_codon:yes gene_type:complete